MFLFATVSAYAGDLYSSSQALAIFSGAHVDTGDDEEPVSLSPKVAAFYRTAGTDTTNQFYAISTGHTGGDTAYAAAANNSNIYFKDFTPGAFDSAVLSGDLIDTMDSANAWGTWTIID